MSSREMTFRLMSLLLVGMAFVASVAGASKGEQKPRPEMQVIVDEIKKVQEVQTINSQPSQPMGQKSQILTRVFKNT